MPYSLSLMILEQLGPNIGQHLEILHGKSALYVGVAPEAVNRTEKTQLPFRNVHNTVPKVTVGRIASTRVISWLNLFKITPESTSAKSFIGAFITVLTRVPCSANPDLNTMFIMICLGNFSKIIPG